MKILRQILTLSLLFTFSGLADDEVPIGDDVLFFMNGDLLHGKFVEFSKGKLLWQRSGGPVTEFPTGEIQQIAFNRGEAYQAFEPTHRVGLVNGDQVPGRVISLNEQIMRVETPFAGQIEIQREMIKGFSKVPGYGQLVFHGPFRDQEWMIVSARSGEEGEEAEASWHHQAATFYCNGVGFAQAAELELPDDFELSFRLSSRQSSLFGVAMFSDMAEIGNESLREEIRSGRSNYYGSRNNDRLHGSSLLLELVGSKATLSEVIPPEPEEAEEDEAAAGEGEEKDADAKEKKEPRGKTVRIGGSSTFVSSSQRYDAEITIRVSRGLGQIQLLTNGNSVATWQIDPEDMPEGKYLKFAQRRGLTSLSNITVSTWNRMPDSARSMQSDDKDVLVLSSGTDRFSGEVLGIADGKLSVSTRFGKMQLGMETVAELVFAGGDQGEVPETDGELVELELAYGGKIQGQLKDRGDKTVFAGQNGVEWPLDVKTLQFIKFDEYDPLLEKWTE